MIGFTLSEPMGSLQRRELRVLLEDQRQVLGCFHPLPRYFHGRSSRFTFLGLPRPKVRDHGSLRDLRVRSRYPTRYSLGCIHRWKSLRRYRSWIGLMPDPNVPIRVFSQVRPRIHRRPLPVGDHHWSLPRRHRQPMHQGSSQSRSVANPYRHPIRLGSYSLRRTESPRFLLLKGRDLDARKSLSILTRRPADSTEVDQECLDITLALEAEKALGQTTYLDCFRNNAARNGWGRGLRWERLGRVEEGWQQLTGVNFVFYYGTTFFKASGIANPFLITVATSVVNVGMTIPGILLIDRFGRRPMLLWGAVVMLTCEYIVAIVGVTRGKVTGDVDTGSQVVNHQAQQTLIAFVCIYIAAFASTWGPIAWVVTGEIFPLGIRGKAMSLSVASNWLWNFGIGYATPYLVDPTTTGVIAIKTAELGVKIYFVWGSTCVGCVLFTYFFVPETKGLSLEQIDLLYRESSIIKSNAYRRQMLERDETFLHHDGAVAGTDAVDLKNLGPEGEKGNVGHDELARHRARDVV